MSLSNHDLITAKEAAELLQKSPRTLETWRGHPKKMQPFGFYYDGYRIWYSRKELEAYKEKSLVRHGPEHVS